MLDLTFLLGGPAVPSAAHRYGAAAAAGEFAVPPAAGARRPVVVWNITAQCNLACAHCYAAQAGAGGPELDRAEGLKLVADLAAWGAPVLLLSGGEPLTRPDALDLARAAADGGMRAVLSSNGTLIDEAAARAIRAAGVAYCGLSLDGAAAANDLFRGRKGAFAATLAAFRRLRDAGQKAGLRFTLAKRNLPDLARILDLVEEEAIPRACFYHLVPAGRGADEEAPAPAEVRRAVDLLIARAGRPPGPRPAPEILTVDGHCDAAYLLWRLRGAGHPRAAEVERLLRWNGGAFHASGTGLGCVGPAGDVHPDQFWRAVVLGNVRRRPFPEIWQDESHPILAGLRNLRPRLKGRCARCRFLDVCGGGLRARAALLEGDPWASDPGCYLTDEEIGLDFPPAR